MFIEPLFMYLAGDCMLCRNLDMSPPARNTNWEDSHETLKAYCKHVSYATVPCRKLWSQQCALNNWFLRTTATIGLHS